MSVSHTPILVPGLEHESVPNPRDDDAIFGEPTGLEETTWPGQTTKAPCDETTEHTVEILRQLRTLHGFQGAILFDGSLHVSLGAVQVDGSNIEFAARLTEDLYLTEMRTGHVLGQGWVEEILTTFETQVHMVHSLRGHGTLFVMLMFDRSKGNFAMARAKLRDVCRALEPLHR